MHSLNLSLTLATPTLHINRLNKFLLISFCLKMSHLIIALWAQGLEAKGPKMLLNVSDNLLA